MKTFGYIMLCILAFLLGVFSVNDEGAYVSDGVVSVVNTTQDTVWVVMNGTPIPILPDNVLEFEGRVTLEVK